MKNVINQKGVSSSSPTTHRATLENQTAIAILEVKGELVPRTSRYLYRQQQLQKLALSFSLVLGTCSFISFPFLTSAVVHQQAKGSGVAQPTATAQNPSASSLATSSNPASPSTKAEDELIYPLVHFAPLTSPFGWRVHPISGQRRLHAGVDFEAPYGAPIVAAIAGTVVMADWDGGHGKTVKIENPGKLQTLYAHMSKIVVQKGQTVKQGDVIGYVGSTGRSTGAHLHFETLIPGKDKTKAASDNWVAIDPAPKVQSALNNLQPSTQISQSNGTSRLN